MKLLCVYCSSQPGGRRRPDAEAAEAIGRELVGRGWGLIYGGG